MNVKTRAAMLTGVLLVGILALSGCVKLTGDINVAPDGAFSGTMGFGIQKQLLSGMGVTSLDDFTKQMSDSTNGPTADSPVDPSTCKASETDTEFIYTCAVPSTPASEMDDPFNLKSDGTTITLAITAQDAAAGEGADIGALTGGLTPTVDMTFTFPGDVTSVTGTGIEKMSADSVRISGKLTEVQGVVTADAVQKSSGAMLIILLLAGVLILVGVLVVVLLLRSRDASVASTPPDGSFAPVDAAPADPGEPVDSMQMEVPEVGEVAPASADPDPDLEP